MRLLKFFVFMLVISVNKVYSSEYLGTVTRVIDGDSVIVKGNDTFNKIRLRYIDAPELSQSYGMQSKKFLQNQLLDKLVLVYTEYNDRFGRQLADIYIHNDKESIYINAKMIKSGNAWVYKKYRSNSYLINLENHAKINNIGIWSMPEPLEPWVYRNKNK
tara:strand:- start:5491 stop:5970 length:480 start_codon:yes stop_codon:yes gene_type:complete